MSEFVRVANVGDLPDPGKMTVEIADRLVLLVHVNGQFHCVDDVCTHDGGTLSDGRLCGFEIACPRHGAKFDVRDGRALTMPATESTGSHTVRVVGSEVQVKLSD